MRIIIPENTNTTLREIARDIPISEIRSAHVKGLINDMKKLLAKEKYGVALAAPQVGEPLKLFVVSGKALARGKRNSLDESTEEKSNEMSSHDKSVKDQVYINPELVKISRAKTSKHVGCLSIRGTWGTVLRAEKATVRAYDEDGKLSTFGASGFLAHIFQHEMDHLNGILYTDKATAVYDENNDEEK